MDDKVRALLEKITWLGHDSFRIAGSKTVYFDPWKLPATVGGDGDLVLVTHEQNISVLNDEEWDSLLAKVDKLTSKYVKAFRSWTYIAKYAENLQNLRIKTVASNSAENELECCLAGRIEMPLYLYVFRGDSEYVNQSFKEIPPFKGEVSIKLAPTDALLKNL